MRKRNVRIYSVITAAFLTVAAVMPSHATSISELQNNIDKDKKNLAHVTGQIADMEDEQEILEETISDLDAELINVMTSIGLLEDEITEKEEAIAKTQQDYEEAKAIEQEQYEAMKVRIKFMYEKGDISYLQLFLSASDMSDMLNKADYIEKFYEYDRKMLEEFQKIRNRVADLCGSLEEDKLSLKDDKENMKEQQIYLDGLLAEKRAQSSNYDVQIAKARQDAAAYKTKIKQEERDLKKLQDSQKKPVSNAASGNYTVTSFDTSVISNASGSELGKKIATYACQYIGNPYVPGGTSLTNGADCSGFVYRVYKDFGHDLPRTSYSLRTAGAGVDYSAAQPGDIVCYEGHVGIYVGGGFLVHASTQKTGIKISNAQYRTILSVRRIV